jgi:hypothetical protein
MADPPAQSYATHRQSVPLYLVSLGLIVATFIGSVVNLSKSWGDDTRFYSASLIVALTIATLMVSLFARSFALRAQDRAIRVEEQLRYFALTGKRLDPRLTIRQVIALRFAADDEFVALAQRAADQGLTPDAIKREVKSWRADTYRV